MNSLDTVEIGATGVRVTRLGLGGAPIGAHLVDVEEAAAVATIERALELEVSYFDTAPLYGFGRSERRYGLALAEVPRDRFVISTKVGRVLKPADPMTPDDGLVPHEFDAVFDFSRDGVLRSLEDSLERLKLDRVDIALIHDPDNHYDQAIGEAYPALHDLRSQGVVRAIGAGMNQCPTLARFARDGDFDCFLLAGRYTLLDQTALPELLPLCQQKGIGIILGGPYNAGVLASDLSPDESYQYTTPSGGSDPVPPDMMARARSIKAVCDRHSVPLKAVALQFGLAHPAVAATIPGAVSPAEVEENYRMAAHPIPADLWAELKQERLIPENAPSTAR
jgi:D-threo-aldose 1-dehydrogenase